MVNTSKGGPNFVLTIVGDIFEQSCRLATRDSGLILLLSEILLLAFASENPTIGRPELKSTYRGGGGNWETVLGSPGAIGGCVIEPLDQGYPGGN